MVFCKVDTHDDGLLAKYNGNECLVSDPKPIMIIQAPPEYSDALDYNQALNNPETHDQTVKDIYC